MQAEPCLRGQDAADRRLESRPRNTTRFDGGLHALERVHRVARVEHDVDARKYGLHRILAGRAQLGHRVHVHRVGVDEPLKAHLLSQQIGHDRRAERRRPGIRVEQRQLDVADHDAGGAGGDAGLEWHELDLVEARARKLQHRQPEMRVHRGVAVPGKVLQRGEHAALLQPAHEGGGHGADPGRILAERSDVDHRVTRIDVHVGHRREVDVHAERPPLACGDAAGLEGELFVARGAECHRARKLRRALDAHPDTPLEVSRRQQRNGGDRLQAVDGGRERQRLPEDDRPVGGVEQDLRRRLFAAEADHTANVRVADKGAQLLEDVGIRAGVDTCEARHQELPDHLIGRQLLHRRVHPALAVAIERRLRRGLTDQNDGHEQRKQCASHRPYCRRDYAIPT